MLKLPRPAAIAIQATLGIALSAPWAVSALAAPATQSQTTPRLQEGDLVRLRSGGPEMTIKSVRGNWVIAIWWNEVFGGFQSAGFPVAMVDGPITLPPLTYVHKQVLPTGATIPRVVLPRVFLPKGATIPQVILAAPDNPIRIPPCRGSIEQGR